MAYNNYNNNYKDDKPTTNTYTPLSFANPDSAIMPSRLSISYFNRVMQIGISKRNPSSSLEDYPTYDLDNTVRVFISANKAKNLYEMCIRLKQDPDNIHNVCVETKNGLLKVSNGAEFGSNSHCISIITSDENNGIVETIYQFKGSETGYYNYDDNDFSTMELMNIEFDYFLMILDQYYLASSYAIPAVVKEATMYQQKAFKDLLTAVAKKTGAITNGGSQNNKTFLQRNNTTPMNVESNNNEYTISTFDEVVSEM